MKKLNESVKIHDHLNPLIWDSNDHLKEVIRQKLLEIVDAYVEYSDVLKVDDIIDVELVGSNASYNYNPGYSDLDLHIVINMRDKSCDPEILQLACNAEKVNFNNRFDITVKGINVELYVEDVGSATSSNGIYSILKDGWIKFPHKIAVFNGDKDPNYIRLLDEWKSLANNLLKVANSASEVQEYINNLYNLRRNSLMVDGEFGFGNLVFKDIRDAGLLEKLKDKQCELSSKELSLESVDLMEKERYEIKRYKNQFGLYDNEQQKFACAGPRYLMVAMKKDFDKKLDESFKKRFRVNYLLGESYHYSMVEAPDEDQADSAVFELLGTPEDFRLLSVESAPEPVVAGPNSALSEIINRLIVDEWDAISSYNTASVSANELGYQNAAKLFADIAKEEYEHVGELQELLEHFDDKTDAIEDGADEAHDKLSVSESVKRIVSRSVSKSRK